MIAATLVMVLSGALPVIGNVLTHTAPAASSPASDAASVSTAASTAGVHPATSPTSPNPGTLKVYEPYPGGATTEDPSVSYDTVSAEPIFNTFEPLTIFNGDNATGATLGQYAPVLATCVPGSSQCTATYGGSGGTNPIPGFTGLFDAAGNPTTYTATGTLGAEYWTFVIDPNAQFYDSGTWEPSGANYTGVSWHVYPTDVMFSWARLLAYSEAVGVGSTAGWLGAQMLLANGTAAFDSGFHTPYNTTPEAIYGSMLINSTAFCPGSAQAKGLGDGCITFKVNGGGALWPSFLQVTSDGFFGTTACGWYSVTGGAALPGWSPSSTDHGDHGCGLPDGAGNSTSYNPTWSSYLDSLNTTTGQKSWDAYELRVALDYPAPAPNVQWHAVGSGAYFMEPTPKSSPAGYTLFQSPAYAQPLACTGTVASLDLPAGSDCYPKADPTYTPPNTPPCASSYSASSCGYIPIVETSYEPSDQAGISAYESGTADLAGIYSTDTSTMLNLASEGKLNWYSAPSLSTYFLPYNLEWSDTAYKAASYAGSPNIPATFLAGSAVRGLLTHAFPYNTAEATAQTVDGVEYAYMAGGPVAEGMVGYPTNVSYPYQQGNPGADASVVNSAAWWWAQGTDTASPYYDADLAACITKTCVFPIVGENGAPNLDIMIQEWITEIKSITDNHLQPYTFDLNFGGPGGFLDTQLVAEPGSGALPIWNLGWAADNFQAWDYLDPMGLPNGTYTHEDAVEQVLLTPAYDDQATCGHSAKTLADLYYWASQAELPSDCQGVAYTLAMDYFAQSDHAGGTLSTLIDWALQGILANLDLYTFFGQSNEVYTVAPWINGSTINTNPSIGGGDDNLWFQVAYVPPEQSVTFSQSGLPGGTWKITAGQPSTVKEGSSSTSSLEFYETTGTVPFSISATDAAVSSVTGATTWDSATDSGTVDVTGTTALTVLFTALPPSPNTELTFSETGLGAGTAWTVSIVQTGKGATGSGTNGTTAPGDLNFTVAKDTDWKFTATAEGLWKGTLKGTIKVGTTAVTKAIDFIQEFATAKFLEKGLAKGLTWGVDISGVPTSAGGNAAGWLNVTSDKASITVKDLPYGTYYYYPTEVVIPGTSAYYTVSPQVSDVLIISTKTQVEKISYGSDKLTFSESGLKKGTDWTVDVSDTLVAANATNDNGSYVNFTGTSDKATQTFEVPYGYYNWTVSATGYTAAPSSSGGVPLNLSEPVKPVTVKITFTANPVPDASALTPVVAAASASRPLP